MKRSLFYLTKIPFLKCLIRIYHLIVEVHNDQNFFTESNFGDWFSNYVQFYSGGHFSERAAAAWQSRKVNHFKLGLSTESFLAFCNFEYSKFPNSFLTFL